jgi:glucose-1-phosphate thymidylyltransferase
MRGIILAGGSGTRLHPITLAVSKQLTPIYDKPLIYYPLSTLMLAGIREVMIITTPHEQAAFRGLLGDGARLGMQFKYVAQPRPDGLAQAFLLDPEFINGEPVALVLGDNIFYAQQLSLTLRKTIAQQDGATVFASRVRDPERYGVVTFDERDRPVALEEKPKEPRSNWAVTGLYFYDGRVSELAATLKPSPRGELEITDLNRLYLEMGKLQVERLGRGTAWLDTGTPESMLQASNFIHVLEERQGMKVACIEEIAWRMGFIDAEQLASLGRELHKSTYGQYLLRLHDEEARGPRE